MKALILAAGMGTRLGSAGTKLPKPLHELFGKPLIVHQIEQIAKAGINEIVINVYHLKHMIMQALGDGSQFGVQINYSIEDELLGTGGGIAKAMPSLSEQFLVVSADVYTSFNYSDLLKLTVPYAHLVLVPNPEFHPEGDFILQDDGFVIPGTNLCKTFGNISILNKKIFANAPAGNFALTKVLYPFMLQNLVSGEYFDGRWYNVGTIRQLQSLNRVVKVQSV